MSVSPTDESILDKLDKVAPAALNQFDAFPKLPSTYKARSGGRGILTLLVALASFLLIVNDIGEYFWGWPVYQFGIDKNEESFMQVNVDLIVNMPCRHLSVDLRDAVGDRLYLSDGFRRDGTLFDISQAQTLQAHTRNLDARQAVAQSRKSRGFFDVIFRRNRDNFRPTYNYKPDGSACRIYGSMPVKKVTANLHITTAGHGYRGIQHVDHSLMNLSHVITDFSFGPYFPDMAQPLKNTFELTHEPFVAYQYFLNVVPTTYLAPGTKPVHTNQYSVTHYTRGPLQHNEGTPGIFFKFDLEPLHMTVHQRTTTFIQFLIRVVGVVGGVWCCAGWAFRISSKAIDVVSGADKTPGLVAAEATGAQTKRKWGGGELRARVGVGVARQGNGWTVDGGSPYGSYAGTPVGSTFGGVLSPAPATGMGMYGGSLSTPGLVPYSPASQQMYGRSVSASSAHGNGTPSGAYGLGLTSAPVSAVPSSALPHGPQQSQSFAAQQQRALSQQQQHYNPAQGGGILPPTPNPYTPSASASAFPPTPNPNPNPRSPLGGMSGPGTPVGFGPHSPALPPPPPQRKRTGSKGEKKMD